MRGVEVIVVTYDPHDILTASKYVKETIVAAHPEKGEEEFIETLVSIADRYTGSLLIPGSDPALAAISRHKGKLVKDYIVACHDWETTKLFLDKMYTYQLADEIGVPAPKTLIPESQDHVARYGKMVQYPCIIKPRQVHIFFDHFKVKMFWIENYDDLIRIYEKTKVVDYDVVIQEFIPGEDNQGANYNSYFWDGQPLIEFTAKKIRNAPPQFGSPRVVVSQDMPEIIESGRKIIPALKFEGYSCAEFKKDVRDNTYKLMEVNGRHNLSSMLAVHCGLNFPWIQYKHLVEGDIPEPLDWEKGVYWIDLLTDALYSVKSLHKERYSLQEYLKPYFSPHVFADLDSKDLGPFFKRWENASKRLLGTKNGT
jgi:predicted ATP-grasp superfamily ATP-dependent carboligase